jgi:hypothetical protein
LVRIIPLYGPKNLPKKSLFLLTVVISGRGTLAGLTGLNRCSNPLSGLLGWVNAGRRCRGLGDYSEQLLEEAALIACSHLAGLAWLGARYEGRWIVIRTYRRGKVIRDFVEAYLHDSWRRRKGLYAILILRKSDSPLHEL